MLSRHGIRKVVNLQVDENSGYAASLFLASQQLNDLMNNPNTDSVFVHSNSDLVKAPTLLMVYLCLFKKVASWKNISRTQAIIAKNLKGATPDVDIV